MALKNLFDMVKADRYTADGREAIIKAQEEETEDKVYQIGEISQKTGLQKTANGWVKPKNGKQPAAKKEPDKFAKEFSETENHSVKLEERKKADKKAVAEEKLKEQRAQGEAAGKAWSEAAERWMKNNPDYKTMKGDDIIKGISEELSKSEESKPAIENKTTIRQGPNTKTLNETPAEHVQKNLDAYKGYQPYDMEELVLKPSGYEKQTSARVPGGGQSITYTKNGAEDITLFFDKHGELENADIAGSKTAEKPALSQTDGKETVVTANGRQDPTSDSAPRVFTGDTRIRIRKA